MDNQETDAMQFLADANPFDYTKNNKLKALFIFIGFFIVFSFIFVSIDKKSGYKIIMPIAVASAICTISYILSIRLVIAINNNLKRSINQVKGLSIKNKLDIILKALLTLILIPNFVKAMQGISGGVKISVFILILILFLIPYWIVFSLIIDKFLKSFYLFSLIAIGLIIIVYGFFSGDPTLGALSVFINFLSGFMKFIAGIFFPSLIIDLVFIEIPYYTRK